MSDGVKKTVLIWIIGCLWIVGCNLGPTQTAGGSSDTEISAKAITGSVVDTNGNPVANAMVMFNSIDSQNNMTPVSPHPVGAPPNSLDVMPIKTDAYGMFSIPNVAAGNYAIEVNSGDSFAVVLYCTFDSADTVKKIPVDTLRPMVVISGTIIPNGSPNPQITIDGLNRPVKIDSTGKFSIKVPAGKHQVKFSQHGPNGKPGIFLPDLEPGQNLDIGYVDPSTVSPLPPCRDSADDVSAIHLMLRDMGLDSAPVDSVVTFKNGRISAVKLRHYKLHFISAEIARLTALETLDIGANQFHTLQAISLCTTLTVLRADSNNLMFVDNGIGSMKQLKELDVSNNEISSLPISIIQLSPDKLKLDNNRLLEMSGAVAQWADSLEPNWRTTQRIGGGVPPFQRDGEGNFH
jgi:hypothetical protein